VEKSGTMGGKWKAVTAGIVRYREPYKDTPRQQKSVPTRIEKNVNLQASSLQMMKNADTSR
jgi:hypothetical protein